MQKIFTSEEIASRILFQDQLIIVLNKPHGIPVHAGANPGYSLEDHFPDLTFGYKELPKLGHRLDRDTSGCLILARNNRAIRKIGLLFENTRINKTYWAIVDGKPPAESGTIDLPLEKIKLPKGWSMQPAKKGAAGAQEAITDYKIMGELSGNRTWLELYPKTGRTHQLRVHLQSLGCPIVNDWLYGPNKDRPDEFLPLHLHARQIEIPLYHDQPPIIVTAPPPEHMSACKV